MTNRGGDMHSHEKTLLSKLGFTDPDRKDPRHDLATAYLAQPEKMAKLAEAARLPWRVRAEVPKRDLCDCQFSGRFVAGALQFEPERELHIQKGTGKYATTVGFLDLVITAGREWRADGVFESRGGDCWEESRLKNEVRPTRPSPYDIETRARDEEGHQRRHDVAQLAYWDEKRIAVEVKSGRETSGDVLRQIALYKAHFDAARWVLATLYDLTKCERDAFEESGLVCVRIGGAAFEAFVEESRNTKATDVPEV